MIKIGSLQKIVKETANVNDDSKSSPNHALLNDASDFRFYQNRKKVTIQTKESIMIRIFGDVEKDNGNVIITNIYQLHKFIKKIKKENIDDQQHLAYNDPEF